MPEYMKDITDKLKEFLYGILPGFILLGIPAIIAVAVWLLANRNDAPRIVDFITIVGDGSFSIGLIFSILGFLGFINAFTAFLLWAKYFLDHVGTAKSFIRFWIPIILATFSWYAFLKIVSILIGMQ